MPKFKWWKDGQIQTLVMGKLSLASIYRQSGGSAEVHLNNDIFGKKAPVTRKNVVVAEDYIFEKVQALFSDANDDFFEFTLEHREKRE
jgi:hypothetical protein